MKAPALAIGCLLLVASVAGADIKYTRLSDTQFVVHHRKLTKFGAEAKATKTAYAEAASICIAAGFTHMEVKDLNVGEREFGGEWGGGRGASADLRIKLYQEPDEATIDEKDLVECGPLSDPVKIQRAKEKLDRDAGKA